ncbi:MAG TPA: hypothetical protein VHL80_20420 [Polyangia bacterium]|nr:hypothetical protein [Polyangia bacterium]
MFVLLCSGCGSGPAIPQAQIEAEWHQAICAREVRCGRMPDLDTCLGATSSPVSAQLAADLASGKVAYSPQGGQALVDGVTATPCGLTASTSLAASTGSRQRFQAAFRGRVPVGGACGADEQCAPPALCDPSRGGGVACGGSCALPPEPKPVGASCGDAAGILLTLSPLCEPSAYCAFEAQDPASALCTALPATAGAPCGDGACGGGLACVPSSTLPDGTCAALAAPGAACDLSLATPCDDPTTYCDPTSKTCLPRVPVGAPCRVSDQSCVAFAACDGASGVCVALSGAGGPCQELGIECLGDLRCADAMTPCALPAQPHTCP